MENTNTNFGNLFGTIQLLNEDHLEAILTTMNKEYATYYIIESVKAAYLRVAYTIGEVEIISKAIRTISSQKDGVENNMDVVENQSNNSPGFSPE